MPFYRHALSLISTRLLRQGEFLKIGLVQISIGLAWSQPGSNEPSTEYELLPYSVGLIASYAKQNAKEQHEFSFPVFSRVAVSEAVEKLIGNDLVAFSLYVWNVNLSLKIAAELKRLKPSILIVVGGPQVPNNCDQFLRANLCVDFACHGEGEITFTELLDAIPTGDFDSVRAISYRDHGGAVITTANRARIVDLDIVPSPYLSGCFDELLASRPDSWVMTWETNRGCPFSCTFCDWGSATAAKVYRFGMERLSNEIQWMSAQKVGFVFCCDANFGMLPRDLEIANSIVAQKKESGYPWSFSVQNTKNSRERAYQVQTVLARDLNTLGVTISLQSANPETLVNIKRRNISSAAFEDLQQRFSRDGVYTYTDLILGLPGDSYKTFTEGVSHVVAKGQHNHIQFHNCSILPNAEMADANYRSKFGLESVSQLIINAWDKADRIEEVPEYLETVVSSNTLPADDWKRAKVFSWMVDLLYFNRLLQVPLSVLTSRHSLGLHGFIESFIECDAETYPIVSEVVNEMQIHARTIQNGGIEFRNSHSLGGVHMPADQFAIARLVFDDKLESFYLEAKSIVNAHLDKNKREESQLFVDDLFAYNAAIFVVPAPPSKPLLVLSHSIAEIYRNVLAGQHYSVEEILVGYSVDRLSKPVETFDAFLGHLAWCHSKDKRNYLASTAPLRLSVPATT